MPSIRDVFIDVPGVYTENSYFTFRTQGHYAHGTYVLDVKKPANQFKRLTMRLRADSSWRLYVFLPEQRKMKLVQRVGKPGVSHRSERPAIEDLSHHLAQSSC